MFHVKLDHTYEKLAALSQLWQTMQKKTVKQYELAASAEYTLGMCVRMQPDLCRRRASASARGDRDGESAGSSPDASARGDRDDESAGSSPNASARGDRDNELAGSSSGSTVRSDRDAESAGSPPGGSSAAEIERRHMQQATEIVKEAARNGKKSPVLERVASAVDILPFADAARAQGTCCARLLINRFHEFWIHLAIRETINCPSCVILRLVSGIYMKI